MDPELKTYALRLGKKADELADENPIPAPSRVLEMLRGVPFPASPQLGALSDNRLLQLAVLASDHAELSPKLEVYPAGLAAERALALAQSALVCPPKEFLTIEEIQKRVTAKYPKAQPLPPRPELDRLLESLSSDLRWDDKLGGGKGGYQSTYRESPTYETSRQLATRLSTQITIQAGVEVAPEVAAARSLEEKLRYASDQGAFLVLSVEPQWLARARNELASRFSVSVCDLDAVFLKELKQHAAQKRAKWEVVVRADAAKPNSTDWRNLQRLVEASMPEVESQLRSRQQTRLVVNPGLLARYDRMNLLAQLLIS